ncbi:hypothetical protein L2E82_27616 [Cichorium intybus]|uniref:Uncharacterized protein n=1 Tax=Cichorium intybus TaxID=13427 RepID=A0ACB9CTU3_CICIN|nr:hypothetical protein L2E82_27616 [Cichorium intybus]
MVEVTIGRKNIKVRVTEVEGKIYNQCNMEKETNCNTETEEEEDSEDEEIFLTSDEESQAIFSDEEVEEDDGQSNFQTTIPETVLNKQTTEEKSTKEREVFRNSSVDGGKVGFSDEDDERYDLDQDEESIVHETVPDVAFNESPAHARDKNEGHATVAKLAETGDTPKAQKMPEEKATDPALGWCACDSNCMVTLCACLSNPANTSKASPANAGKNSVGTVTVAVVHDAEGTPNTKKKVEENVKDSKFQRCACVAVVPDEIDTPKTKKKVEEYVKNYEIIRCACVVNNPNSLCTCVLKGEHDIPKMSQHNYPIGSLPDLQKAIKKWSEEKKKEKLMKIRTDGSVD